MLECHMLLTCPVKVRLVYTRNKDLNKKDFKPRLV